MLQMNIMVKTIPQKKLDRKKFNKQLQKAISTALYSAQEANRNSSNIYSSVDKGITDLASRDLSEDFANELFKQAQQQPENVEVLLKEYNNLKLGCKTLRR